MKKLLVPMAALFLLTTVSSCAKCYVCSKTDKKDGTYVKETYCDKDFSKGDVNSAIRDAEDDGYTCHASSRAI